MHRNQSVDVHKFAMVPRADIPRSGFKIENTHKLTLNSGVLVPVYVNEVLPGDSFNMRMTAFARIATPIVPVMDNLYLESFFFFVPCRLLWDKWQRFMGEREDPDASIDFTIPQIVSEVGGHFEGSIYDYMGIPCEGQIDPLESISHSALPLRAYNLIWNEWFRDQNLQDRVPRNIGDGPDSVDDYALRRRGKRHDYFTSCLPWVQKGSPVALPLGTSAPVMTVGSSLVTGPQSALTFRNTSTGASVSNTGTLGISTFSAMSYNASGIGSVVGDLYPDNLYADLSAATAATINDIRQAFQIQKLLERDARGGTRYTELVKSHFGVLSPDSRLQRPEYLGGGMTPINIHPIAQTANDGDGLPVGSLAAYGTALAQGHGFTQSFTEHGYIIGLVSIRADMTYQQGLRKMWSRQTRYDFYWPVFAMLGEQAVLQKEIYMTGDSANDEAVFGYQERWAEYRYHPSQVSALLRSTSATPLDVWHLAQYFDSPPALNELFIEEDPPVDRIIATTSQTGMQFVCDIFFRNKAARPLPMYSVPGLVDHF